MADEEPQYTGVVIVLVPAAGDPTHEASSEPAHLTTVWMGDLADQSGEQIQAIIAETEAYAAQLDGPVVVPVTERGVLGDEGADVVFLERTESLVALRDGLLEASPTVRAAFEAVEQYPEWTPHVTLGYPETPAAGEYDGDTVTFDRIGVWVAEDQHDFDMGGAVSDEIEASAVTARFVLETRDAETNRRDTIGPFSAVEDAEARKDVIVATGFNGDVTVFDLAQVIADVEDVDDAEIEADLTIDQPDEDEEEITEFPVHGVAAVEGIPTGDGRGFRPDALQIGPLPQPLGFEFESGHGSDNSRVAVIGRIDEFFRVEIPGGAEIRWRGVIMPHKEYASRAIESIIDGSFTGLSVIVDSVAIDVEEEREELRKRILAERAGEKEPVDGATEVPAAVEDEEMDVEELVDLMVGDGTQKTTWFSNAQIRRFDMVPTGALHQGYIALGHEFVDEMEPDQIEASANALADCGCGDLDAAAEAIIAAAQGESFAPGTKDGPGWITHPTATARIRRYWVRGKGAAKIKWGVPGDFNRCRSQLSKYVQNPEWLAGLCANMHKEAIGVWPGQEGGGRHSLLASGQHQAAKLFTLVAAAEPIDASFFRLPPNLTDHGIGVVIDGDHVYGYIAHWNVCHIGQPEGPGTCTYAPKSRTGYAHFRTGTVHTTEGPMAVGSITMGTGHAGGSKSASAAAAHYDNTGATVADVACGENSHGIWFAGRIRPWATDQQRHELAASGRLSGDWRNIGGNYELVAALAVNVPGYPIPRASLVASAEGGLSLVAAGIPPLEEGDTHVLGEEGETVTFTAEDVERLARQAVDKFVRQERVTRELAPIRESVRAKALSFARARLSRED